MKTSIIIVSYGSDWWKRIGDTRATPSAESQGDYEIIRIHRDDPETNLSALRNQAAVLATGERIVFLDADDELESGYIDAMLAASGDVRYPRIRVLCEGPNESPMPDPFEIPERPILEGNFVIISAMVRRDAFLKLGGFDPSLNYCEDWDFYIRASLAGLKFQLVTQAIYRQHWRPGSRNQVECHQGELLRQQIRDRYQPQLTSGLLS